MWTCQQPDPGQINRLKSIGKGQMCLTLALEKLHCKNAGLVSESVFWRPTCRQCLVQWSFCTSVRRREEEGVKCFDQWAEWDYEARMQLVVRLRSTFLLDDQRRQWRTMPYQEPIPPSYPPICERSPSMKNYGLQYSTDSGLLCGHFSCLYSPRVAWTAVS